MIKSCLNFYTDSAMSQNCTYFAFHPTMNISKKFIFDNFLFLLFQAKMEPNVFSEFHLPPSFKFNLPTPKNYNLRKNLIIIPTQTKNHQNLKDPEIPSSSVAAYKNKNDDIQYL